MRDGAKLSALVYRPAEQPTVGCILSITPYGAQRQNALAIWFARHGYTYVAAESRGRGGSDGVFRPNLNEAKDGYDAVEWLAKQPGCGDKVVMWGLSYMGHVQWSTAKERPPHLATIVPVASPSMAVDFPMRGNIPTLYAARYLTFVSGRSAQDNIFADMEYWNGLYKEHARSGAPYEAFGRYAGNRQDIFAEWAAHLQPDAYWDAYEPSAEQLAALDIPILTITGSHDVDQPGALGHYRRHMRFGSADAKARHHLVIGPWDHTGTMAPQAEFGGLKFGPASLVDINQLHLDWYGWVLGRGPKPAFLKDRVAYYVMDADTWRYAPTLEAVTARHEKLHLTSSGDADVFGAGALSPTPARRPGSSSYVYDPRDLSRLEEDPGDPFSLVDQRDAYRGPGKQLVYHSRPFDRPVEISGTFRFQAWISIDQPDTDFMVSIHEVRPDGGSVLLSTDLKRARYREDPRVEKLITTTKPLLYDFDGFTFVSRQVRKGSRLRLVIAPVTAIDKQRNYNSGGPPAKESAADARVVTVRLHQGGAYDSVLVVPFGRETAPGG